MSHTFCVSSCERDSESGTSDSVGVDPSLSSDASTDTVVIRNVTVHYRRATCKRASREGRPRQPSLRAQIAAKDKIFSYEQEYYCQGRRLLLPTPSSVPFCNRQTRTTHKHVAKKSLASTSSSIETENRFAPTTSDDAASTTSFHSKVAHLQTLKSRTADAFNYEPAYLLGDRTAELQFDRLLESSLRANAGSQAVTKRRATQGAANQTTRVNCRASGMAAAVQCTNVSITIAIAECMLRSKHKISTVNPYGITAFEPAQLCLSSSEQISMLFNDRSDAGEPEQIFPVIASTELVYNSVASKLGVSSIRICAKELASRELSEHLISRSMYSDAMLTSLCHSIGGGYDIDAIWASIVLVVFLSHDPRGRRLLANSKLTDLDLQTACVLECYGRAEITRRVRLLEQQANGGQTKGRGKRKVVCDSDDEDDNKEENDDEDDHSETKMLGVKRRRCGKMTNSQFSSSAVCESKSLIIWWFHALRSQQSSVLETLVASSRETAREAAKSSLKRQVGENADVIGNKTLNGISETTAVRSCEELVRLVHVRSSSIPKFVSVKSKWLNSVSIGLVQIPNSVNKSALHACQLLPRKLQPHADSHTVIVHSSAVQEFSQRGDDYGSEQNITERSDATCPGILERYCRLSELTSGSAKQHKIRSNVQSYIEYETRRPLLSLYSGTTRSFISFQLSIPITHSMMESASVLCIEAVELHRKSTPNARDGEETTKNSPLSEIGTSSNELLRQEPLCTPCSRLAIGIRLNELLRRWMMGRTRKNGIALLLCGSTADNEIPKDLGLIMDTEPLPMAIITDFKIRMNDLDSNSELLNNVSDGGVRTASAVVGASLNVCLEGAVRVPELVSHTDDLFERRALMIVASSQASYIGDVGSALSAQWANCSSASSKKVSCADVNTLPLLSVWDTYAGGLTNVHRNYTKTVYSGTYGPHVDTGITAPGLLGNYYRSDFRKHGTISIGQATADKLCSVVTESHYVPIGDQYFATSPIQTRGIPHGFVPGLHSVLNDYNSALETYRELSHRETDPTVDGLFSLPFGPFTQALAPDVESTVDLTIRHAFRRPQESSVATGRSYLPDTTSEDEAIFIEPLWRRPCQVCSNDNPFATSYGNADSMFNAMNLIALMIIDIGDRDGIHKPEQQLSHFHDFVTNTVFENDTSEQVARQSRIWVTDFLVLVFGVIYPASHKINVSVVPSEISNLASRMSRICKIQQTNGKIPTGCKFSSLISNEEIEKVQYLWSKFSKRQLDKCPWNMGMKPLLSLLIKQRGSNNVDQNTIQKMRSAVDWIPRSAWLVYSEDGITQPPFPNPLWDCASFDNVQRTHLDPIFAAQGENLEILPRGALIGLLPFQLRQIYAMMLGCHIQNVSPQVVRNEGGLNLRLSSAADILKRNGNPRTDKAISPLQVEADTDAFGTRDAKLYGCALQRNAWDRNARKMAPLFAALEPPQSDEKLSRGEWGEASWLKAMLDDGDNVSQVKFDVEKIARNQLENAAKNSIDPKLAWAR